MERSSLGKSKPLKGEVKIPGDKSITHRAIILGSIAHGETRVNGFLAAEDCLRTIVAFQSLAVKITREKQSLSIQGGGFHGLKESEDVIDLGNSGTGIRLLAGVLAGQARLPDGQEFFSILTGDSSLRQRPMRRVVEPLRQMGAVIHGRQGGNLAPLAILGRPLNGIQYDLPIPSAQVKSALLLAGLHASGATIIREQAKSRDHTERLLKHFGVDVEEQGLTVSVKGPVTLQGREIQIPGDISSAAFLMVAASAVKGSQITLLEVGINPTRTGILEILLEMGADIKVENRRELCGEPVADITIQSSPLKGTMIKGEKTLRALDEFPILCVAAALASGETVIMDARELRVKESDRIAVMVQELGKMGVQLEEFPDGVRIVGKGRLQGAVCDSHGDHRVALALSVAGLVAKGETVVRNTECIETSFPGFYSLLESLKAD
jgi:3-phosphoshikimate 1-carboxyvinyltransferase